MNKLSCAHHPDWPSVDFHFAIFASDSSEKMLWIQGTVMDAHPISFTFLQSPCAGSAVHFWGCLYIFTAFIYTAWPNNAGLGVPGVCVYRATPVESIL